jgi:hypothetical protein
MILPLRTLREYARFTCPSAHAREASIERACGTVFAFTFGTTHRATTGVRGGGG